MKTAEYDYWKRRLGPEHEELMKRVNALSRRQRRRLFHFLCGYASPNGLKQGLDLVTSDVTPDA